MIFELKPCAFCKSDEYVTFDSTMLNLAKREIFCIQCTRCGVRMTKHCNHRDDFYENVINELVETWNNRKKKGNKK